MLWEWKIEHNHFVLNSGNETFLPEAKSVYSAINSTEQIITVDGRECCNPKDLFPAIRFSKLGSPIQCRFFSESDHIYCSVFVTRRQSMVQLDYCNGRIVDHCIYNNEWFYVTGDLLDLQKSLLNAGISGQGQVSMAEYLKVVKDNVFSDYSFIANDVDIDELKSQSGSLSVPNTLNATLYPYQEQGYRWMSYMLNESQGCLLGDEMGLGKTIQVITVILSLIDQGKGPILVIAPVSLLANWKSEIAKFAPSVKTIVHHGLHRTGNPAVFRDNDVVISGYSTVCTDFSIISMIKWELVVLDEAQNIKNYDSQRARLVKKIPRKSNIAVTGTPFENHITDVWSLMDFIFPGLFGSISQFTSSIPDNIEGGKRIEPVVSPLMLRRLVKDVAQDLPEKIIIPQPLQMSETEIRGYNEIRKIVSDTLSTDGISIMTIQKLRMFCTHPDVSSGSLTSNPYETSIKYQRLTELIEEIITKGEKVIVFTSFTRMIDILVNDLSGRFHVKTMSIFGETPINERQSIVEQFNEYPRPAVLVLNPRAAGVGLNITGANHVIHYNLEWNPAIEDQASARAHRRGQSKTVFVYRLYYENTVEQVINDRINRKRDIATSTIIGTDGAEQDRKDILAAISLIPEII